VAYPPTRPPEPTSRGRRAFYALSAIAAVMVVGTIGFHEIEGMSWVDSFYFESMLATGQGPPIPLVTDAGKIFASIMAFVSVGSVITALVVTLAPIFSQLWREGLERAERDAKRLEAELSRKKEAES
jgi:voltage-gated potassium channel